MSSSSEKSRLHRERRRLIRVLESTAPLAVGSVARVHRRCGNPRCGCRDGKGHAQVLFLSKAGMKRRCQLVRRADEKMMLEASRRYRAWRDAWRKLRAIENRQKEIWLAEMKKRGIQYK
jgi:hypothetical protein